MDWANRFGSTRLLDVLLYDPNNVRTHVTHGGAVALILFLSRLQFRQVSSGTVEVSNYFCSRVFGNFPVREE